MDEMVRATLSLHGFTPDVVMDRERTAQALTQCGFRVRPQTLALLASRDRGGLRYHIGAGNRAYYRLGDAMAYMISRRAKPRTAPLRSNSPGAAA